MKSIIVAHLSDGFNLPHGIIDNVSCGFISNQDMINGLVYCGVHQTEVEHHHLTKQRYLQ